jgi:hypothetical protein
MRITAAAMPQPALQQSDRITRREGPAMHVFDLAKEAS